MRPGQLRPGNSTWDRISRLSPMGFNEAGAASPRKSAQYVRGSPASGRFNEAGAASPRKFGVLTSFGAPVALLQ